MKQIVFNIRKIKRKAIWTEEEDRKLTLLVSLNSKNSWRNISENLKGKTPYECFLRFRSIRPGLKKGNWSKDEDEDIIRGVERFGTKWFLIGRHVFKNRTAKQIRDRYINYLDPNVKKGKFSLDEDDLIIQLFKKIGPKWTKIQKFLPKRTADAIKNRYNSCLKKRTHGPKIIICTNEEVNIF